MSKKDITEIMNEWKKEFSTIITTPNNKGNLTDKIEKMSNNEGTGKLDDETAWTALIALLYKDTPDTLFKILTGSQSFGFKKIWLEAQPLPPYVGERNTHLDLAIGGIARRETTSNNKADTADPTSMAVKYDGSISKSVCFCEMKWESDISHSIENNPKRNQIARVIENLLCFQDNNRNHPEEYYFTLVTPKIFIEKTKPYSRFYAYKYNEYKNEPETLIKEFEIARKYLFRENGIERKSDYWEYPSDMEAKIKRLTIGWVTYDELIEKAPETPLKKEIQKLFEKGIVQCNFRENL